MFLTNSSSDKLVLLNYLIVLKYTFSKRQKHLIDHWKPLEDSFKIK